MMIALLENRGAHSRSLACRGALRVTAEPGGHLCENESRKLWALKEVA